MNENKNCAQGLSTYARQRSEETVRCVNEVIDELRAQNLPVNFETVAKRSGVSRGTLYNHRELSERIRCLRDNGTDTAGERLREENRRQQEKMRGLRARIRCLEEEKKKLIVQLIDHEELRRENERLRQRIASAENSFTE